MPANPTADAPRTARNTLIRLSQISLEFSCALSAATAVADQLHHNQIEGLATHLKRIQAQLNQSLETIQTAATQKAL